MQKTITTFLTLFLTTSTLVQGTSNFTSTPQKTNCLVLSNALGYTPVSTSKKLTTFNWLAVKNGRFTGVGKGKPPKMFAHCQNVNARNAFVLPGLTDAHAHIMNLAYELTQVDVRGIDTLAATVDKIHQYSQQNPQVDWILGRGWNQVIWPTKKFPTHQDLDRVISDKPVVLRRVDGHAVWANAKAMQLAGITSKTPSPRGGKIIKDKDGNPTGVFVDNAVPLIESKVPVASDEQKQYALNKAFRHLLSLGLVSVHEAGIDAWQLAFYQKSAQDHQLPIRIYAMLSGDRPQLHQWLENGPVKDKDEFLSVRSVKLYADGALGSRGAALLKPYSDDPHNKGLLITKPQQMYQLMLDIISHGFQVNVHAIGDRGNRIVLDNLEKVYKLIGGSNLRNRIEHSQVVALSDIPRFKKLNVIASMQPTHATSDMNMAEDRIGKERLKGAYAWRKFLDQGTIIAAGSDFPVEKANPFYGLYSAITRQDHQGHPKGGWIPSEAMTPTEALRAFTLDAAYAAFQEQTMGSIEIGKWADFIVVDKDVIKGDPKDIWKTQVLQTWIAGKKVYQQ